ncbi:hypothetical protein [Pseudomonas veronii]|uniref:hypothetical protein n=1 Tax=Pseudomonas veronii TaxID=76761 RepID=UPI001E3EF6E1|nr:hypothetical protein [Pseudomonas veronii]
MFLKFDWRRPNDDAPLSAKIIEPAPIDGLGEVAAELAKSLPNWRGRGLTTQLRSTTRWRQLIGGLTASCLDPAHR